MVSSYFLLCKNAPLLLEGHFIMLFSKITGYRGADLNCRPQGYESCALTS
jgi:hypothetical protein